MGARRYPEEIQSCRERMTGSQNYYHRHHYSTDQCCKCSPLVTKFVLASKESLPGYPEPMRLGWILGVTEDHGDVRYEVAVALPNTKGTILVLPADQIELAAPAS